LRRRRLAVVLITLAVLASAGTAVGVRVTLLAQQQRFHANFPNDPDRLSPFVELDSGRDWALIAWKSDAGVCLDYAIPGTAAFNCGFPVRGVTPAVDSGAGPPAQSVAGFVSTLRQSENLAPVFGVAAANVASVRLELRDGRVVDATTYDAPVELGENVRFFLVHLDVPKRVCQLARTCIGYYDPVRAFLAYDRSGQLIARVRE
jgi:hypothetical protein